MLNFSIIITVYNKEKTLEKCLDSIVLDSNRDYEIIIVDDGSTDNSYDIAYMYSQKDDRIKLYKQKNYGIGYSRRKSIEYANGRYLLFVDADDCIANDLLKTLREKIIKYNCPDVIKYNIMEVNSNKNPDRFIINNNEIISGLEALYKWNCDVYIRYGVFSMYTFNTDFLKKHLFDFVEFDCYEDVATITKILFYSKRILILDYIGYYYYRNNDSITLDRKTNKLYYFKLARNEILNFYEDKLGIESDLYQVIKSYYDYHLKRKEKELA